MSDIYDGLPREREESETPPEGVLSACDVVLEELYSLSRAELRRVAWEALLMSDGPDQIGIGEPGGTVSVYVRKDGFGVTLAWNSEERAALGDLRLKGTQR
jgi:hypothetical protein